MSTSLLLTVYYIDENLATTVHVPTHHVLEDVLHAFNKKTDCEIPWKNAKFYLPPSLPLKPRKTLSQRVAEWLYAHANDDGVEEESTTKLRTIPGIPHDDNDVDIIIAVDPVDEHRDALAPLQHKFKEEYKDLDAALGKSSSPSEGSKSDTAVKQETDKGIVVYGRPFNNRGPPNSFFAPELARLAYDLENPSVPPDARRELISTVLTFMRTTCEFCDTEKTRLKMLINCIEDVFPGKIQWDKPVSDIEKARADGRWAVKDCQEEFVFAILELKNTRGGSGDPRFQNLLMYEKQIDSIKKYHQITNFPMLLLTLTANRLDIETAVFTDAVYCEHLLTLDLALPFRKTEYVNRVIEVIYAVRKCMGRLKTFYLSLPTLGAPVPYKQILPHILPNPTAADNNPYDALPAGLTFLCRLSWLGKRLDLRVDSTTRWKGPLYLARLGDKEVVVKFTEQYNAEAHKLLAAQDLAPRLHAFVAVVGGLMVVMDYLPEAQGGMLKVATRPHRAGIQKAVRRALTLLHDNGLVFGDMREQNVLHIRPSEDGRDEDRAWLIDFDWVGKAGEATYPPMMSTDVTWASGMGPGKVMEVAHDEELFDMMFRRV